MELRGETSRETESPLPFFAAVVPTAGNLLGRLFIGLLYSRGKSYNYVTLEQMRKVRLVGSSSAHGYVYTISIIGAHHAVVSQYVVKND